MSDQFMQEVQEEEHSIEDLERKISQGTGIGEAAADDMIRANEEAQAIEVDTLKDTVLAYQRQIEELKELGSLTPQNPPEPSGLYFLSKSKYFYMVIR